MSASIFFFFFSFSMNDLRSYHCWLVIRCTIYPVIFVCHKVCEKLGKFGTFFICISHLLQFKKFLIAKKTCPDIISVYWIFRDVKVIVKKAKIRSWKLLGISHYNTSNIFCVSFLLSSNVNFFHRGDIYTF